MSGDPASTSPTARPLPFRRSGPPTSTASFGSCPSSQPPLCLPAPTISPLPRARNTPARATASVHIYWVSRPRLLLPPMISPFPRGRSWPHRSTASFPHHPSRRPRLPLPTPVISPLPRPRGRSRPPSSTASFPRPILRVDLGSRLEQRQQSHHIRTASYVKQVGIVEHVQQR